MYKACGVVLVLALIGCSTATRPFKTSSKNLQSPTSDIRGNNVDLDVCPTCIDEAVEAINVILNVILDEGILADCKKLCDAVANKTGSHLVGTVCDLACDGVGIDEFVRLIISTDLDPIWYCEMADLCPINDHGDAKFTNFGVTPNTAPEGTTFLLDCSFKSLNGTGTSMLRIEMSDPQNQTSSDDILVESRKAGTYGEKLTFKSAGFTPGVYNVSAQLCNGECGSHHPHSGTYDVGLTTFTVTKKK